MIKILVTMFFFTTALFAGDSPLFTLFPNGTVKTLLNAPDNFQQIYGPIQLRNKSGFIPLKEVQKISLNDTVDIIAFMIYLEDSEIPFEEMPLNHLPKGEREILLQVIAWNTKSRTFITKPSGFPLRASQWTCYGDVCEIVLLTDLEKVKGSEALVYIDYITNTEYSKMRQYFNFRLGTLFTTEPLDVGNRMDWGNDTEYSISYTDEEALAKGMATTKNSNADIVKKESLFLYWQ